MDTDKHNVSGVKIWADLVPKTYAGIELYDSSKERDGNGYESTTTLETGSCNGVRFAVVSDQGWRKTMEDDFLVVETDSLGGSVSLFGVFDGTGGREVARYVAQNMAREIRDNSKFKMATQDWDNIDVPLLEECLVEVYMKIDDDIASPEGLERLRDLEAGGKYCEKRVKENSTVQKQEGKTSSLVKLSNRRKMSSSLSDLAHVHSSATSDPPCPSTKGHSNSAAEDRTETIELPLSMPDVTRQPRCLSPHALPVPVEFLPADLTTEGLPTTRAVPRFSLRSDTEVPEPRVRRRKPPEMRELPDTSHFLSEEERNDWMSVVSDEEPGFRSGTTVVIVLLTPNHIVVANVGDSRCGTIRRGQRGMEIVTVSHSLRDPKERNRFHATEELARHTAGDRVEGCLTNTRMIGCHSLKRIDRGVASPLEQKVIACPDVTTVRRTSSDLFLVIGTDGVWNHLLQTDENERAFVLEEEVKWLARESRETGGADILALASYFCKMSQSEGLDNATIVLVELMEK